VADAVVEARQQHRIQPLPSCLDWNNSWPRVNPAHPIPLRSSEPSWSGRPGCSPIPERRKTQQWHGISPLARESLGLCARTRDLVVVGSSPTRPTPKGPEMPTVIRAPRCSAGAGVAPLLPPLLPAAVAGGDRACSGYAETMETGRLIAGVGLAVALVGALASPAGTATTKRTS
jgi:hypothetical protein